MSILKSVTSARTGQVLAYHEVFQVSASEAQVTVLVASYPDQAAKTAKKQPSEFIPLTFPYAQASVGKGLFAWAQDLVVTSPQFIGATVS